MVKPTPDGLELPVTEHKLIITIASIFVEYKNGQIYYGPEVNSIRSYPFDSKETSKIYSLNSEGAVYMGCEKKHNDNSWWFEMIPLTESISQRASRMNINRKLE
jgi:hypothetical protein